MNSKGKTATALFSTPVKIVLIAAVITGGALYAIPSFFSLSYDSQVPVPPAAVGKSIEEELPPPPVHLDTPEAVKAIYMSACVAGTRDFREDLVTLVEETELNSIIIDIKDYTGEISFPTEDPLLRDAAFQRCGAPDMKDFIAYLHEKGIYVIGRITVFQDPLYSMAHPDLAVQRTDRSVWKDYKGLSFVDVGSVPYWEYIVALSKESYAVGFDELNFDYIRYPSDGNLRDVYYPQSDGENKAEELERFFAYLDQKLQDTGAVLSADLFGMTTTNTDDLNIGQVLERALPYFDYIAPMVYPSHYPSGFNGWGNPNNYPYEIVKYSMDEAVTRTAATTTTVKTLGGELISTSTPYLYSKPAYDSQKMRPWLQDFDYGGDYDIADVRAQIKATYDAGLTSWMLWAPSNRYTRGALLPVYKEDESPENGV